MLRVASARKSSGMSAALIWRPCAHAKSMPRITYSVPSVITSDGTRAQATITPLIRPKKAPNRIPPTNTSGIGMPWSANITPVAKAVMPRIEPTLRSMLRVTTTIV